MNVVSSEARQYPGSTGNAVTVAPGSSHSTPCENRNILGEQMKVVFVTYSRSIISKCGEYAFTYITGILAGREMGAGKGFNSELFMPRL